MGVGSQSPYTRDVDYELNVQKGKKPYWKEDDAPDPLFTRVDKEAIRRPTYSAIAALLQHYSHDELSVNSQVVKDPGNCEQVWKFSVQ